MTTIALVGGAATTRGAVQYSQADEVWAANWSYKYDYVPRIDRLFEMHPVWLYAATDKATWIKPKEHWDWLQLEHPYPIYCLQKHPDVPAAVRYPIEEVIEECFSSLKRRNWEEGITKSTRFFTSSFDYMFGLAILMRDEWNIDTLEVFGVEMAADTEYRYQKYGASYFLGVATAKGMEVIIPHNSVIAKSKMYGYEGAQMIFRTDLERYLAMYNKTRTEEASKLNHLEGQYAQLEVNLQEAFNEHGIDSDISRDAAEKVKEMAQNIQDARDITSIAAGAFQAVKHLIDEVDLEVPSGELNTIWGEVEVVT